jgi:hypothetical protein
MRTEKKKTYIQRGHLFLIKETKKNRCSILGLLKVLWSDGSIDKCKFGINDQYDILMSKDQSIDSSKLKVGSIVVRGNVQVFNLLFITAVVKCFICCKYLTVYTMHVHCVYVLYVDA